MTRQRRHCLGAVLGAALTVRWPAFAQPGDRLVRIGWLGNNEGGTPRARAIREALLDELQRRGWVQGRNLVLEFRYAEGVPDRFAVHAHQMVLLQPDLIVAVGAAAAAAVKLARRFPWSSSACPRPRNGAW